jgi:hypothetical protein
LKFSFLNEITLSTDHVIISRFMTEKIMPLSQAVEAYELFNAMKVQKVVFVADQ